MDQLELFHGDHVPLTAARRALARGDVAEAGAQLAARPAGSAEAADGLRLQVIAEALARDGVARDPAAVHEIFAAALTRWPARGSLAGPEWFAVYARALAAALAHTPGRRLRGWLGVHFAWAAGDAQQALALTQACMELRASAPDALEIARIAFALGRTGLAQTWLRETLLASHDELSPGRPVLEPCGVPALDTAPALPPLPDAVEQLWVHVAMLALDGARTPWIAVVGEIDGVLAAPADAPDLAASSPPAPDAQDLPAPQAFISALRAARRARTRDGYHLPDHCSDRELRARRRMQQLSPVLLARYLSVLHASLC